MAKRVIIYCPDCRGKFELDIADVIEGDIIECDLCGAEMIVVQEDPVKLKLYSEDEHDY